MSTGIVRWSASALTLAVAAWGTYYGIVVPATARSLDSYVNAQACGYEQGQWVKTNYSAYGDNHLRAVGFARLTIVCAGQPKVIEDTKKTVNPNVVEMSKQSDIQPMPWSKPRNSICRIAARTVAGGFTNNKAHRMDWAQEQFRKFRGCVAFVETQDKERNVGIGTCFHVGNGVFVTARHVIDGQTITQIGFDDSVTSLQLVEKPEHWGGKSHGAVTILDGPFTHIDETIDVACFRCEPYPTSWIPLGGHLDDWLGEFELVLHKVLLLGYPPIPFSNRPALVASAGEINALIDKYTGGHPHFIVSSMARGGFSGGPALVAYNQDDLQNGTAALGLVTESLNKNGQAAELGYMAILTVEPIYECLEQHELLPHFQELSFDVDKLNVQGGELHPKI